jgi:hypothetical protein
VLASVAFYSGGAVTLAGFVALFRRRTRKTGAALIAGGVTMAAAALAWPVSEERVASTQSHLDEAMPRWQFNEVHEIDVDADPQRIYDAVKAVRADEIAFFRALTWIRRGGRKQREDILNAGKTKPLLEIATSTTFFYLADEKPHEIVVGTHISRDVDAAMNFLIEPRRVTTETRVFARTPAAARQFAVYWRIIHPGSDIIRRMWLRAVKRRAEAA